LAGTLWLRVFFVNDVGPQGRSIAARRDDPSADCARSEAPPALTAREKAATSEPQSLSAMSAMSAMVRSVSRRRHRAIWSRTAAISVRIEAPRSTCRPPGS